MAANNLQLGTCQFSFIISGWNKSKANLISKMNFKTPEDAKPFYSVPTTSLINIYKTIKHDQNSGFCENRIYYIADRIKVQ